MTAMPVPFAPQPAPLVAPMTAAEYAATPETEARYELQEGMLVMAASPVPRHQVALVRAVVQLEPQIPSDLQLMVEVDIDLQLVSPDQPGTVRVPDLVVVRRTAYDRVNAEGGLLHAGDVVLAVEIHSTSTRRTDTVLKRSEYADAGIGHYWMIDLLDGPSLTACHLGGEFGYVDAGSMRGAIRTEHPFPAQIELDRLG